MAAAGLTLAVAIAAGLGLGSIDGDVDSAESETTAQDATASVAKWGRITPVDAPSASAEASSAGETAIQPGVFGTSAVVLQAIDGPQLNPASTVRLGSVRAKLSALRSTAIEHAVQRPGASSDVELTAGADTSGGDEQPALGAPPPVPHAAADAHEMADQPIATADAGPALRVAPQPQPQQRDNAPTHTVKVKPGDSLYGILKSRGLSPTVLPALLSVGKHGDRLKRIRPGQALELYTDARGRLQRLDYQPDELTTVSYRREGTGFAGALMQTPLERRERTVNGVIESSLFLDGHRAGLSDRVIMQMAEIFGWDVDFALDLRDGDRFTVIYEELLKEGRKLRDGDILAAEFISRGRVFRAVRFVTPEGETRYFTPEGRAMRKAFLRTPVRFARISSRFNLRRKHPVLHKVRAHRGVDYAAPRGTPIKATGDGRVEFKGRKGGYGKVVIIRHTGGVYSTLYAHMNGFARGIRTGSVVKQGQTIGYVGSSGLATGPHLHYEFRVRGVHKDPLRIRLPKSLPIARSHKREFQRQARKYIARLNASGATIAQND